MLQECSHFWTVVGWSISLSSAFQLTSLGFGRSLLLYSYFLDRIPLLSPCEQPHRGLKCRFLSCCPLRLCPSRSWQSDGLRSWLPVTEVNFGFGVEIQAEFTELDRKWSNFAKAPSDSTFTFWELLGQFFRDPSLNLLRDLSNVVFIEDLCLIFLENFLDLSLHQSYLAALLTFSYSWYFSLSIKKCSRWKVWITRGNSCTKYCEDKFGCQFPEKDEY